MVKTCWSKLYLYDSLPFSSVLFRENYPGYWYIGTVIACFSISGTLIQQVIAQVMPVFALMYYFMKNESAGKQLLPWWSNFYVYGSHLIHAHCSLHQCKLLKVMNILVNIVTLMICLELNPRMFFDFFLLKVPKLKYSALFWMCTGCSDFFYFYL